MRPGKRRGDRFELEQQLGDGGMGAVCEAMGGCSLFRGPFVRLAHAEALHATGAHDAARRAIAGARARLLAIAGKIPDPSYRTSFLEQVPENARTLALADAWLGDPAPSDPAGS